MSCVSIFERPTLPSLRTLDLPVPLTQNRQFSNSMYDSYEPQVSPIVSSFSYPPTTPTSNVSVRQSCPSRNVLRHWPYSRQVSTSSSSSRTPSPNPSNYSSYTNTHSHPNPSLPPTRSSSAPKFRLVPSTLDVADAVVVVPPPTAPFIPNLTSTPSLMESARQGQALLLLGPALQHFRHPQRQIAKGARIHPYRIIRGGDTCRRTSSSFTLSV